MDFEQYVAARRIPVLRAAVLLGVSEARAPALLDEVLLDRARAIRRSPDPDPEVYAALVAALPDRPAPSPEGREPGHAVRRELAALDPPTRGVAVLSAHADLTPAATADALGLTRAEVLAAERAAWRGLGAPDRLRAQTLLAHAADSVDVPLLLPLSPPRRRWRPTLLAAAAAAAVVGIGALALAPRDEAPTPPPDGVIDPDELPVLYGYDVDEATLLLAARGLTVDRRTAYTCDPVGTVLATDPPVGTRVDDGEPVTLVTAFPAGDSCQGIYPERSAAWEVLRFAAGRGPAPAFAREVTVVVDGGRPRTLAGAEAGLRVRWGDPSPLAALAETLEVVEDPGAPTARSPLLRVDTGRPPATACGVDRSPAFGRREALTLSVATGDPGICPLTVDLYYRGDRLDGLALRSAH